MEYPKTYTTPEGPVTVLEFGKYRLRGEYCYRVVLTGAIDRFLGADARIVERRDRPDGSAIIAYQPDYADSDYQFVRDFAAKLDALNDWPANSEVL